MFYSLFQYAIYNYPYFAAVGCDPTDTGIISPSRNTGVPYMNIIDSNNYPINYPKRILK